ncbi:MAG TPA: Ig-like domain-containing protein, partial [Paracoccaceae bacterium]|nr:Ig-like domain-containing protein [Paracoccaceae bacterium]
MASIVDGSSNAILLGEAVPDLGSGDGSARPIGGSGGTSFGDGSVRRIGGSGGAGFGDGSVRLAGIKDGSSNTIIVGEVPPPVAVDDVYQVLEGRRLVVPAELGLLANDEGSDNGFKVISIIAQTEVAPPEFAPDGSFVFSPPAGFVGTASFLCTIVDANGLRATAALTIEVADDLPPLAIDDVFVVRAGEVLQAAAPGLLENDADPEGGPLAVTGIGIAGTRGTVAIGAGGGFSFTAEADFIGVTSFTYTVADEIGQAASAVVTIEVVALAPVGTAGDDVLQGTVLGDPINGFGGNDEIAGGASDDVLIGGAGNDRLLGEAGADRLNGGGGRDELDGGEGLDVVRGGRGADILRG